MTAAARTTIVTVCYNSLAVLPAMLASVPKGVPVILVDNASTEAGPLDDLAEQAGARLVRNDRNLGFGTACNAGAALAETEFLLFLNPDAALEPGCIAALEAAMDRYPKAVALNPRIIAADGSPYFKRRSALLPRRQWLPRGWPAADREVPVLHGSALMVRRADFAAVAGFDPAIFLYHEDDDLSLRLKADRGRLMFVRDAAVRHAGGSSAPRSPEVAALKAWHMGRSRVYAARKHGRPWPVATALAGAIAQMLSPLNLVSRRKAAKALAFARGVLDGASR